MSLYYLPIEQQLSILEDLYSKAQKALSTRPPGNLTVQRWRNTSQYYYRPAADSSRRRYIKKENLYFIKELAQKEYETSFLRTVLHQKESLYKALSSGTPRSASLMYHALALPFERLSKERQALITPYVLPDGLYIRSFLDTVYEKKGFSESATVIMTENGERVRSKSEKIIADKLNSLGIPYLYEYPLYLQRLGWIHPDFTLLDVRERTTVILEHFGLMQDLSYVAQAMNKIDSYIFDGYFPGDRLLITYEGGSHVLNVDTLERLIRHRFSS